MLALEDKKKVVTEVAKVVDSAQSVVAAHYQGLTVGEMTSLREQARKESVDVRVIKNTLVRRAVKDGHFACIDGDLKGPLVFAFSEDHSAAARVFHDFSKEHDKLIIRIVALADKLLQPQDIVRLAKMPTYDQAVSMLMSAMKAPVEKFARTLSAPNSKMVRTFAAIRDQKQAA